MPLKLYERPNGIWHIRGTVQDRRIDQSAKTRKRGEAEQIRAKLEADLFKRSVYGDDAVATFAEAAEAYMMAGGEGYHLTPLIERLGLKKLSDIGQADLDLIAAERPLVKPATLVRQIYTPAGAVMAFAASPAGGQLCRPIIFRKPSVRGGRTAFLTPAEAEAWIEALPPYLKRLVIFYLATGCRATEAIELQWRDVSPAGERVVFWETKSGYARGVDLQRRAREALGERGEGHVFLNSRGEPWHGYDAINLMLKRHRERRLAELTAKPKSKPTLAPAHCHLFRHTWATWAYACTHDLTFLMQQGGWRSVAMVMRYAHAASSDLADAVNRAGWEIRGRSDPRPQRRKR